MNAAQALGELMDLSSQIESAVVLGPDGALLAASGDDARTTALAASVQELVLAAADLGTEGSEVTRVEVELDEGALFAVREGGHTVGAVTVSNPTSGLVVYDLRTCAQAITPTEPKKRRARKPKEESA